MITGRSLLLLATLLTAACTVSTAPVPASAPYPASQTPQRVEFVESPAPPPAPRPAAGMAGWYSLGQLKVERPGERDALRVGPYRGRFRGVMIRAENGSLRMRDVVIVYTNGSRYYPNVDLRFRPGETQSFDLPDHDRTIDRVEFRSSDVSDDVRPRVEVFAR